MITRFRKRMTILVLLPFVVIGCSSKKKESEKEKRADALVSQAVEKAETTKNNESLAKDKESKKEVKLDPQVLYKELKAAIRSGSEQRVVSEAAKNLSKNKKDITTLNALSLFYFSKGKIDLAKTILQRAFEAEAQNSELYNNLGVILLSEEKTAEAIVAFRESLKLDPKNIKAIENLGGIYSKYSDFMRAVGIYQKADESQLSGSAMNNYAVALWKTGDRSSSEKVFGAAVEKIKDAGPLFNQILFFTYELKDFSRAEKALSQLPSARGYKSYAQRARLIETYIQRTRK